MASRFTTRASKFRVIAAPMQVNNRYINNLNAQLPLPIEYAINTLLSLDGVVFQILCQEVTNEGPHKALISNLETTYPMADFVVVYI